MPSYPLLDKINSPEDFRRIERSELPRLAAEIRSFLVDTVSKTGGHLASNLGVVELTLALHTVFTSPEDRLIFDVGHQSYVHKLITGRREGFPTLRKKGGMSGFPKRSESEYDAFDTGHASTSVSAAVGMLRADVMLGRKRNVVAIVGDGAMTGGMCFEALNDAGESKLPLVVILNDNDMSIAHNVGALSLHLANLRSSEGYQRFKSRVAGFLAHIPLVGKRLSEATLRFKNKIKYLVLPNVLFEELGYTYLGPVDGHDINALVRILDQAKGLDHPVVVHIVTKKGRGYGPAEREPERFHGIGSFDPATGESKKSGEPSNSSVFAEELTKLASRDKSICAITAAMADGTGLARFGAEFPSRLFDVGIAEEHAVTMAAGMAAAGAKPVVAIYSSFLQRAYDQIMHDVCLQGLHVVFAIDRAGLVGEDGETHHGVYDMSFLRSLPGITIMTPSTRAELRKMLGLALALEGPCAIRYNRGSLPEGEDCEIEPGKWTELEPIGDVTVVAFGRLVGTALEAAAGTDAGVIDARFVKPMDGEMLGRMAARSKRVITLEDGSVEGGAGMEIKARLAGSCRVECLGIPEAPVQHATRAEQDELCGISVDAVRKRLYAAISEAEL